MAEDKLKCLTISDFNVSNFNSYLMNEGQPPFVETIEVSYGQLTQTLLGSGQEVWQQHPDLAVVWTRPEAVIGLFKKCLNGEPLSVDVILDGVDAFSDLLAGIRERVKTVFIPTWVLPPTHRSFASMAMKNGVGIDNIIMRMNLRLAERLGDIPGYYLLNAQNWIGAAGKAALNEKLWYMAKIPYGNQVFKEAVQDIKSALTGLSGNSKKLIILDLDDTLWGGVVGDIGWENLILGGHDPNGEAFVDFQNALKYLTNRGILLGIVSKNEESVALEAIKNHPEMVLRLEDFAGWKINWQDKARNVAELVSELNLGIQSAVFIDDNPVERARVRESLPEVFVPEWPEDKMLYRKGLLGLSCFNTPSVSEEDLKRTKMYAAEKQRTALKNKVTSLEDWLKTLDIRVKVSKYNETNLTRTIQLLNKTNQMNLTTRRMTEQELANWVKEEHHYLWTFRISDKFGDSGLTGIISMEIFDKKAGIVDFILSCRVMGRKIEETMLATAISFAETKNIKEITARYLPTLKNKPCLDFWKRSGFSLNDTGDTFHWTTGKPYPHPEQVTVESES